MQKYAVSLALSLSLVGCSLFRSDPKQPPVDPRAAIIEAASKKETSQPQTEAYLDLVEQEVSKAVSGLKAAMEGVDGPDLNKKAVEAQIDRLTGIAKPNVEDLESYQKALKAGDENFVKRDREEAGKVDEKTTAKWKDAEKAKKQVEEANARAKAAEKALADLQTQETLEDVRTAFIAIGGLFLVAGMGLTIAGVWTGLSRLKTSGLYSLGAGMGLVATPIFLPTILMQPWFSYTAGAILLALIAYMAFTVIKAKSCLTPLPKDVDNTPAG